MKATKALSSATFVLMISGLLAVSNGFAPESVSFRQTFPLFGAPQSEEKHVESVLFVECGRLRMRDSVKDVKERFLSSTGLTLSCVHT
jgi:hypothetical protein